MASHMYRETGALALPGEVAATLSPGSLEQYRLDRLLELRAVVDSLRLERGQELLADARAQYEGDCRF